MLKNHNYNLGIALKMLNLFIFAMMSFFMSIVQDSAIQNTFLISLFALIFLIPSMLIAKTSYFVTHNIGSYIYRSFFQVFAMISWLEALQNLQSNTAVVMSYTTPIFASVLASIFCGERFNKQCFIAVLLSFTGVYMITIKFAIISNHNSYGLLCALFSALMWACHDIMCKIQTATENVFTQTFYTFLILFVMTIPVALYSWEPIYYDSLPILIFVSLLSIANITILFLSYKFAPIILLMPLTYLKMPFMVVGTYILLGETVITEMIAGSIIILISSAYILIRQRQGKIII